jgi:hypothetical protein
MTTPTSPAATPDGIPVLTLTLLTDDVTRFGVCRCVLCHIAALMLWPR